MTLHVTGVSKHFAGVRALDEVSLTLETGEVLGLIGPNGSGKSTLVNVITGVLTPDEGAVQVDGVEVTGLSPTAIARHGVSRTFQTVRLFDELSVEDNVLSVMRGSAISIDDSSSDYVDRLGLERFAKTTADHLPYGLQRRLEVARALATNPNYILLDEPAAGLNDTESRDLEDAIAGIPKDEHLGCGVLVIDHDLRFIMSLCDRIVAISSGQIIAEGSPDEVRNHPAVIEAYLGRSG